jgi:hypothetical protein
MTQRHPPPSQARSLANERERNPGSNPGMNVRRHAIGQEAALPGQHVIEALARLSEEYADRAQLRHYLAAPILTLGCKV